MSIGRQEGDNPEIAQRLPLGGLDTFVGFTGLVCVVNKIVRPRSLHRLLRTLLVSCCGVVIVGTAAGSIAGVASMGSVFAHGSGHLLPKPQLHLAERTTERSWVKQTRVKPTPSYLATEPVVAGLSNTLQKSGRLATIAEDAEARGKSVLRDAMVKQALLAALASPTPSGHSDDPTKSSNAIAAVAIPSAERFARQPVALADKPPTQLAYAAPSQSAVAGTAFSALMATSIEDDPEETQDTDTVDVSADMPDYADTPVSGPLPQLRPRDILAKKPAAEPETAGPKQLQDAAAAEIANTAKPDLDETQKPQKVAFVRPDNPATNRSGGGLGQTLRNMFGGGAKAGNGVAVYDISAARVYMPDGSVLEAHSGIGKMADNPRYVNVKMTGPTPPHTYNLRMRETRFHGVEAIRMLPIDGKNKHGRDGFLTHSYLLRGKRAESHGCVAFADYPRFLTAFKQGKVKQIVVVPSGGRAAGMYLASNGKNS